MHTTAQAQDQVQSRLFLDVVIRQSTTVLQLLAGENQTLLIGGNAFFVLDFGLDIFDGVGSLHIEGDCLASQSLDEDLHTTAQAQNQVQSRLFLDIVIRQSTTVLQLLAGENQTLLIGGNAFFVLNLGLDIFDGVGSLH